jgi:hypothetical protein
LLEHRYLWQQAPQFHRNSLLIGIL